SEPNKELVVSVETDRWVGRTPYTVQGWRPNSATNQPTSQAIQGNGREYRASFSNHFFSVKLPLMEAQKEAVKRNNMKKPRPTMARNDQNSGLTAGMVSLAAWAIISGVAWPTSAL